MTKLLVFKANDPARILFETKDFAVIAEKVAALGAHIERWQARHPLGADASNDDVLAAYSHEIERLKRERGYTHQDVVRLKPGNHNWPELRQKFLQEHIHTDDEVRFFVEGSGAFYLHIDANVYQLITEAGDLLSVPHGTKHWYDGGPDADFTAIRLFTDQEGWVAHFTGETISEEFPKYEIAA